MKSISIEETGWDFCSSVWHVPLTTLKFWTHLQWFIFEMMVSLLFSSLVDYYVVSLQVETSLDMRNTERARA